jgi:hypothetical protein
MFARLQQFVRSLRNCHSEVCGIQEVNDFIYFAAASHRRINNVAYLSYQMEEVCKSIRRRMYVENNSKESIVSSIEYP